MDILATFLGVKWRAPYLRATHTGKKKVEIGGYCAGLDIERCRKAFGDRLAAVCATCPD